MQLNTSSSMIGWITAGAGDVNGDGIADYLVTAPSADTSSKTDMGSAFIVFGSSTIAPVNLDTLVSDGKGIRLDGVPGSQLGYSAASAGDVNGDGLGDVVISAIYADGPTGRTQAGKTYVLFGSAISQTIDLATTNLVSSGLGLEIYGRLYETSGTSVSGAGDVNADGFADIVIGSPAHQNDLTTLDYNGVAYVIFGSAITRSIDLTQVLAGSVPSVGYAITTNEINSGLGVAVSGAGDFNGDGFVDIVLGANKNTGANSAVANGRAYVVFGSKLTNNRSVESLVTSNTGIIINGAVAGDKFGASVASIGDINRDGLADIIVGAPFADPQGKSDAGTSYVIFGSKQAVPIDTASLVSVGQGVVITGKWAGSQSGWSVAGASDFNDDGYQDILIGAPQHGDGGWNVYLVYGGPTLNGTIDLSHFVENGQGILIEPYDYLGGYSVSALSDINGDGRNDIIVGSAGAGRAHILFGTISSESGGAQFKIASIAGDPPKTAVGRLGNGLSDETPEADLWIDYANSTLDTVVTTTQVTTRPIASNEFANLNQAQIINKLWQISSSRVNTTGTKLTFSYNNAEASAFSETQLRVLYSADGISWRPLATDNSQLARNQLTVTTNTLGYFAIGLPQATGAPSAQLLSTTPITVPGAMNQQFTVRYSDGKALINTSSLGGGDIVVTGPNGFSANATLVSMTPSGNSATIDAIYQFTPPGGSWDLSDSGQYAINLYANQVFNTNGAPATGENIGSLTVDLPVVFGDADVGIAVREALGKTLDSPLRVSEMAALTTLTLDATKIDSLVGLEWAKNLKELSITPSNWSSATPGIVSFSPIQGLSHLETLSLQRVGIDTADLSAFSSLAALKSLDLRYNQISSLSGQGYLKNLTSLSLYGNPVTDLSLLRGSLVQVDLTPSHADQAKTIAELARALNYSAVYMYEWVYNHVEMQLYAGFMKGAQATLETLQGNAWDQAGLLMALYQQAGIQTRLVTGRAQLYSVDALKPWLGVQDGEGVGSLLYSAGLDPRADGTLAHAWVEALLPDGQGGQSWLAMDPSYKAKAFQAGLNDILTAVPFDETGYLSHTTRELPIEYWQNQIKTWLAQNHPDKTIADVGFQGSIIQKDFSALPGLTYGVSNIEGRYSNFDEDVTNNIPAAMSYAEIVTLKQGNNTLLSYRFELPVVSLSRVTLSYTLAAGQASIVSSYGGLKHTPDGAIQVIPQLKLDGVVVASGGPVAWRSAVTIITDIDRPDNADWGSAFSHREVTREAGQYHVIILDAAQYSQALLARKTETLLAANLAARNAGVTVATNGNPYDAEGQIGSLLDLAGAKWEFNVQSSDNELFELNHYVPVPSPDLAIVTSEAYGDYYWDLMVPFVPEGALIDVSGGEALDAIDGAPDMAEIFKLRTLSLWNGSALEHDIWEELINTETISTVKSLQLANERGIPVYTITPQNASIYLSQLKLGDKNTAIADEFNKEGASRVIVARDLTVLQKWTGTGWFTERADGSIGARISGTVVAGGGQAASAPTTLGTDTPKGAITAQSTAGDPVNIANGNYTHDEQDISLPGAGFGLQFNRHYDSQSSSDLGMGRGWTFSYGDKLTIAADGALTWITDQGYKLTFKSNGSGGYINPDRYFGSFSKDATGYSYREVDGFVHRFDLSGKLVLLTDRNSNQVSFSYDSNGHLSAVTDVDAPSRKLTFTWTGNLLTAVTDFGGRSWGFAYTNNLLTAVNRPTNVNTPASAIHYSYYNDTARNGWIQSITAADGGVTRFEYYTNGRVFRVTDALGEVQTFYYSLYHQQTEFVNERGEVTTYSYDKSGRMVGLENPDHTSESFTYVNGLLTAKTDEFGTPTTYVYDNRGNIVRTVDKAGIETTNTYDTTYNQITSQTRTADGQTTRYQYDSRGNLIRIQDALGNITTMSYDSRGLMTSRTAPNGNATATVGDYTTTYTYNNAGQVLTEANDLPATVSHGYDSLGREISRTDANGNTTTIAYDLLSRVVNIIDPLNHATQRRYDAAGNLIAVTDALGQTTGFSYDLKQRQVAAIAADGTEVHYAYDAVGNRIQATDALGRLTHYLYDDRNRLVETVAPDGARQSIDYDGGSRLIAQTDALGNTSSVSYDKAGRVIKTTDALGHNASSAYDNVGRLSTSTDRRGAVTRYSYDGLDRVIRTEEPGGQITTRSFDANGNTVSLGQYDILGLGSVPTNLSTLDSARQRISQIHYDVANRAVESIDPLGQANVTQYDAGGRVIRQTDSRGSVTSFQYDAAGNLVRRTAADSGVTQYSYDALNRQTSNTMPGGGVWQTGYDKLGHTTSQTDPQNKTTNYGYDAVGNQTRQQNADGSAIVNSYDLRNRIVSVNRSNGSDDVYNFDLAGNLTRASNADSETLFTYDTLNRRISESETLNDGYNLNLSYSYDAEGHLLSQAQTGPWTRTLNYQYDLAGRMTQASSSDGLSANVTYNGFGERTQINLGNGVIENTSFDKAGRVSQISYTTAGNNHSSLTYLRDAGGLPTQVSENLNGVLATLNLTQDAMGRVTAVTGNTNRSENFSYDLNGNLYGDANVTTPSGTTAGLAGYWSGNGNVTDSSTNNNSGSFNGTYVDNGKGALAFNLSSGIVSIPDNPAYSFGDSFTISFAFNVNGTNGKGVYIGQDEGGGSFPKWFIDYGYQGNYFEFHTNDVNNQSAFIASDTVSLSAGWNQFSLVKQNNDYYFYLNGQSIGHSVSTVPVSNPNTRLTLGYGEPNVPRFLGLMSNVSIFNRALSANEVQSLASGLPVGLAGNSPGSNTTLNFNNADELISGSAGQTYSNDSQGNLTVNRAADGSRTETQYDASNRIIELRQYNNTGTLTRSVSYTYDALGRRVRITEGTSITYQVFAGESLLGNVKKQGLTTHQTQYLTGLGCAPCKGGALPVGERPTRLHRSGRKQLEQSWR